MSVLTRGLVLLGTGCVSLTYHHFPVLVTIRNSMDCVGQHCLLIRDITIPSKAIVIDVDVDHAPLARCGGKGFFVAGGRASLAVNQGPPDDRFCWFILELLQQPRQTT